MTNLKTFNVLCISVISLNRVLESLKSFTVVVLSFGLQEMLQSFFKAVSRGGVETAMTTVLYISVPVQFHVRVSFWPGKPRQLSLPASENFFPVFEAEHPLFARDKKMVIETKEKKKSKIEILLNYKFVSLYFLQQKVVLRMERGELQKLCEQKEKYRMREKG